MLDSTPCGLLFQQHHAVWTEVVFRRFEKIQFKKIKNFSFSRQESTTPNHEIVAPEKDQNLFRITEDSLGVAQMCSKNLWGIFQSWDLFLDIVQQTIWKLSLFLNN